MRHLKSSGESDLGRSMAAISAYCATRVSENSSKPTSDCGSDCGSDRHSAAAYTGSTAVFRCLIIMPMTDRWFFGPQCISMEMITGRLDITNAHSARDLATSSNGSTVQKVCLRNRNHFSGDCAIVKVY
eukprot:5043790-Prymnesium_polylepis.2